MRRGRLLLPWGLLAGLLIWTATVEGLSIKAPSLLKKPRNLTASATTTTTTTSLPAAHGELNESEQDEEEELEEELESSSQSSVNVTEKSRLSGNPQEDYIYDPNLPRELPPGYNLSSYPFFSRVPNNVTFECSEDLLDGYYANVHYKCQVYHHCLSGIRYDFLCANYTAFDQKTFICHFVSEVDCANSAKFWIKNKGLYETPTTSTVRPLTTVPPPTAAPVRRPASGPGAGGRRRRPYRRRRPAYDYYYDDEYDDEYEDDVTAPGQSARKRPDVPASTAAAVEAPTDDKPFKADSSIYDRPRQPPKIRRPVPVSERDKFEYSPKESGDKKESDRTPERELDRKRPQDGADYDKPRGQEVSQPRGRTKQRPVADDDEYYDDEEYEQPRTTSRKNNQDYYAPSGGDRDFGRRPAMTGVGRPLRRNRPGARRRPVDDDYYDDRDRRPYRASTSDDEPRRRPAARDDEPRRRPSVREEEPRRRPSSRDEEPRRRPATSDEEAPRRRPIEGDARRKPAKEEEPDRRPSSSEDDVRRRPTDEEPRRRPVDDEPRRRPVEEDSRRKPAVVEEDVRRRPTAPEEDSRRRPTVSPRKRVAQRDDYEKDSLPARDTVRPQSSRESAYERPTGSGRDVVVDRVPERPLTTGRDASFDRVPERPLTTGRDASFDRVPDRPLTTGRDASFDRPTLRTQSSRDYIDDRSTERTRPSRVNSDVAPTGPGSSYVRPARGQTSREVVESDDPIPAAKPAYISTTGRGSYKQRVADEEVYRGAVRNTKPVSVEEEVRVPPTGGGAYRGSIRNSPAVKSTTEHVEFASTAPASHRPTSRTAAPVKTTEAPVYDDEYYDDEEEEGVEVLTGPGRVTNVQQVLKEEIPVVKKPVTSGRKDEVYADTEDVRTKIDIRGRFNEDERRAASTSEPPVINAEVDGTGRVVTATERVHARPIVEQAAAKRRPSSSYHFNSDDELVETSTRPPFRPKSVTTTTTPSPTTSATTTAVYQEKATEGVGELRHSYQSNFRRKSNQASNIESTKVLPSQDELRDIEDVHQPSTAHASTSAPPPKITEATLRYETDKFDVRKPLDVFPPTGKSAIHYLKHGAVRFPDEYSRRPVPDIADSEYDVTLNEAVHPTRIPLNDGGTRIKIKVPIYQYGTLDPTGPSGHLKKTATLLSSASQTHIAKTPYPAAHDKPLIEEEYDDAPIEDEYEDTDVPTGKGATKPTYQDTNNKGTSVNNGYEWTTFPSTVPRGSEVSLPPNTGATGHYILQTNSPRQQGFARPAFEHQPVLSAVRNNGQQFFKQGHVREPTLYHGGLNPLAFSVGYDYDYRPQRKYVRRGAYDYFGKPY